MSCFTRAGRFEAYQNSLCSSVMSDSGWRPTQARKMLVKALRCLARALTTGVPGGVKGACWC
jgi:hypothetical protein